MRHELAVMFSILGLLMFSWQSFAQEESLQIDIVAEMPITDLDTTETVEWSPDGQYLAVGGTGGVLIFDENMEITQHLFQDFLRIHSLSWSPDGSRLAVASEEFTNTQNIAILNITTGNYLILDRPAPMTPIVWSPMSGYIVLGLHNRTTLIIDTVTWETIATFTGEGDLSNLNYPKDYCWFSEDTLVASYGMNAYVLSLPSGNLLQEYLGGESGTIECLPDYSMILSSGGSLRNLETGDWQIPEGWLSGFDISLHPSEQYLAINSGEFLVEIRSADDMHLLAEIAGGTLSSNLTLVRYHDSIDWHPDGELLAAVGEDNILRIWRVVEEN